MLATTIANVSQCTSSTHTHNSYLQLHIVKTEAEAPSLSSKQLILALSGVLFIMLKQKYLKVANSKVFEYKLGRTSAQLQQKD